MELGHVINNNINSQISKKSIMHELFENFYVLKNYILSYSSNMMNIITNRSRETGLSFLTHTRIGF